MGLLDSLFTPFSQMPQEDKEHLVLRIRNDRNRVKPKKERKPRAKKSSIDKAKKLLEKLSPEEIQAILAAEE